MKRFEGTPPPTMQHNQIYISHILLPPCQILAQRNPITDKMKTDGEKLLPTPLKTLKLTNFSQTD